MILTPLRNQKGIALLSVYVASAFITALAAASFGRAFNEARLVEREITRVQTYAAAEAGLQQAVTQVAQNAYTGFINDNDIASSSLQDVSGNALADYEVLVSYPNRADWVVVESEATIGDETRRVQARVFLDSNLAKYLVYADTSSFGSGTNATYGIHNGTDPHGVPKDGNERAMMYFTGNWSASGSNVNVYGDVNVEGSVTGSSSSTVHGDSYVQTFQTDSNGNVINDGVSNVQVGDGFSDDVDRNGDGVVTTQDRPDHHDITQYGEGDSHKTETIVDIDMSFYATHNNTPQFNTGSSQSRYIEFQADSTSGSTYIIEYTNRDFNEVANTYNLPSTAIVYVKGDAWVKGEIGGRVSVVTSDDIMLVDDITYANGQKYCDPDNSAAFMAKDRMYFMGDTMSVSGILYGENSSNATKVFDAYYNSQGQSDPYSKEKLRLYGNRVMNGGTNLSYYGDRVYGYDPDLKRYRPPGIPVVPTVRVVREMTPQG